MRFAAISDIHGNVDALRAVLADIADQGITDIVNLGDSLSGPLDPVATAQILMAQDWPTVSGNHDRTLVDRPFEEMGLWEVWTWPELSAEVLDWLRALDGPHAWRGVLLTHGSPASDEENWLSTRDGTGGMRERTLDEIAGIAGDHGERLLLSGHTHMPRMVRLPDGRCLVNPGSVGLPAYADPRPPVPTIMETGAPDARYAICEDGPSGWRVSLRAVPYDASRMVALALQKDAPDWAEALSRGWMRPR